MYTIRVCTGITERAYLRITQQIYEIDYKFFLKDLFRVDNLSSRVEFGMVHLNLNYENLIVFFCTIMSYDVNRQIFRFREFVL